MVRAPLPLLGNGVYSFAEAAKYAGLKQARIREWFRVKDGTAALFVSDYGDTTEQRLVSFRDLIEVFIAGQLRDHGANLKHIRQVHATLMAEWNEPHPFCRRELVVHGKRILYRGLSEEGRQQIHDVLTKQRAFPDIIVPFLKTLDYDNDLAVRWRIANGVEIDPAYRWGQPVASNSKIPTYILSNSFHANGQQADAVAHWFEVTKEDVLAAVEFERMLAA
jgi:uncharacterized protein (DUF433 family)